MFINFDFCLIIMGSDDIINLEESQWWDFEKLREFQNKRLRIIMDYAYNNVKGYKKIFDDVNISPEDIKSISDLKKLPIITRKIFRNNPDFINEAKINSTLYTGGSTGESLKYYGCKEYDNIRMQAHRRGWKWNGYRGGKKLAIIASAQGTVHGKNNLNISGDLRKEDLPKIVEELEKFKPDHIRGYVSSIYILANYLLSNNKKIPVESVNPISENLYDYQRKVIEKAFGPVFEEYCCNDGGACAWECSKHTFLHYAMERAIIEVVDGKMIVTDLWNKAMPFIRYENGDMVEFIDKKCSCGRELPLIKVKGRENDILITPFGEKISPTYLMYYGIGYQSDSNDNKFKNGFSAIQYIQQPGNILEINIIKNENFSNEQITDFKKFIDKIFKGMKININFVDKIKTTKSGKRRFIINNDL